MLVRSIENGALKPCLGASLPGTLGDGAEFSCTKPSANASRASRPKMIVIEPDRVESPLS